MKVTGILSAVNRARPQFFERAGQVILFITAPLLLVVFWLVFLTDFLSLTQPVAELVITNPSLIRLLSAATALLYASLFFLPREGSRLVGKWNDYVGLAFATISIQYGLRFVAWTFRDVASPEFGSTIQFVSAFVIYLLSFVNNLFFLAAAQVLLNKSNLTRDNGGISDQAGTVQAPSHITINSIPEVLRLTPKWVWIFALLSPLAMLDGQAAFRWARIPDAIFTTYCLTWFGYASAINFNVRRRGSLALLALIVAVTYASGQLIYAINPFVANSINIKMNSVSAPLTDRPNKVEELVHRINASAQRGVTLEEFLDTAAYAVLLPLKLALFVPTFLLYLLFIVSINDFRSTLTSTTGSRRDYLSAQGIVRAVGQSLGAEKVCLFIRLPGINSRPAGEECVLPLLWDPGTNTSTDGTEPLIPIVSDPLLVGMMKEDGEEICVRSKAPKQTDAAISDIFFPHFVLAVPVRFQGGVIGVLRADVRGYGAFNHTNLQKLRLMAELIAPSVQDFRSLAAIDLLGYRFARIQVDEPNGTLKESTAKMVEALHDSLSPLATGLILDMGFSSIKHIRANEDVLLTRLIEEHTTTNHSWSPITRTLTARTFKIETSKMLAGRHEREHDGSQLGRLVLAVRADRDPFFRPTLASYYLNRRTVASLTSEGVLELTRNFFGSIIKDLGVQLNRETLSREEWFEALICAIRRANLLWIVAVKTNDQVVGEQSVEVMSHLTEAERQMLWSQPLRSFMSSPAELNGRIVRLSLNRSRYQLWMGVERQDFGEELEYKSPWKMFLDDLAKVADMALDSIEKRQETELEKIKVAQYQGIMTIAVTTGTLMHQLVNMIKDQLFATECLEETLEDNAIELGPSGTRLLSAMKRSAGQMRQLTEAFKSVTKMEERRPCSVAEAAKQAMKLFRVSLMQKNIKTDIDISNELRADIPFHVVAFALANLIGNAKDAIRSNGSIRLLTEEHDRFILCHVVNSGPPIPQETRDSLFQFGRTTKPGHNGWGLYLVARSLQENGAGICLDGSVEETRFTIRLPKALNEAFEYSGHSRIKEGVDSRPI
jgi:signal transduction histidine kinase